MELEDKKCLTWLSIHTISHGRSQDFELGGSLGRTINPHSYLEIAAAMTSLDSTQANYSLA